MASFPSMEQEALVISHPTTARAVPAQVQPSPKGFSISNLPPELRHQIYANYFHSLPPLAISQNTLSALKPAATTVGSSDTDTSTIQLLNKHILSTNHLALASSFFESDIHSNILFSNLAFAFSCACVLKSFSSLFNPPQTNPQLPLSVPVRRLRISYGPLGRRSPDWVYIMTACLPSLEEVVFVIDTRSCGNEECEAGRGGRFGGWWECTRDAVRESVAVQRKAMRMLVRVEDVKGNEMACERFGGKNLEKRV